MLAGSQARMPGNDASTLQPTTGPVESTPDETYERLRRRIQLALTRRRRRPESTFGVVHIALKLSRQPDASVHSAVIRRLSSALRAGDVMAGEAHAFDLLVDDADENLGILKAAERMTAHLRYPIRCGSDEVFVVPRVGVATPAEGDTPDTLLRAAKDAALRADDRAPRPIEVADQSVHTRLLTQAELAASLARRWTEIS